MIQATLTIRNTVTAVIDGRVFRMHYKTTVAILAIFSAILGVFQFFGDPIDCVSDISSTAAANILDSYCWTENSYHKKDEILDQYSEPYPQYFKWVVYLLFFQMCTMYLPHALWKRLEGNRMQRYIAEVSSDPQGMKIETLVSTLDLTIGRNIFNNNYLREYLFCSLLNLIFLFGQIFIIDYFFGYEFRTYGIDAFKSILFIGNSQIDPMARHFPKTVACYFPWDHKSLCVLNVNVVNEKNFLFLWFWFAGLLILSALASCLWIATLFDLKLRALRLLLLTRGINNPATQNFQRKLNLLVSRCTLGDWFVLYLLGKNLDGCTFKTLLLKLFILKEGNSRSGY